MQRYGHIIILNKQVTIILRKAIYYYYEKKTSRKLFQVSTTFERGILFILDANKALSFDKDNMIACLYELKR
jgi:hypothetical protein